MLNDSTDMSPLHDFLDDAHALLSRAHDCLQHFQLIGEDADASDCLIRTLRTLMEKAKPREQEQIAGFCQQLIALLEPSHRRNPLHGTALGILEACLSLLAWQVELIDPFTGTLNLDNEEQQELLEHLGKLLDPAQTACDQSVENA